ncbi:hypothetical protein AMJ49_05480 [Parcubacteria bacterium DG_74_2]|nr:MAG: hypothetical protein AMJ49_05480 [Parcubacteria bacterium DG_74_2]
MIKTIKYKKITWIDIERPDEKDIEYLRTNFNFHPIILAELIPPSYFSKVKKYDNYIYFIFYYPFYHNIKRQTRARELDVLITKNVLITSHYQPIVPLKAVWDACNLYKEEKEKYLTQGTGFLLYSILDKTFSECLLKLNRIEKRIGFVENEIFAGKEKEMVKEISIVKRDIIDFYRIIEPQKSVINSLVSEGGKFWGRKFLPYFSNLASSFGVCWNRIRNFQDIIKALEETNNSLLTNKINEIVKILTIFSVIVFPLTLLASIFGMNTKYLPLVGIKGDFWIVLGIMGIGTLFMLGLFKKKKWL